ncbi:MAG: hypothetical protein ACYDCQ_11920 [Dehalococcoidia bacterium]
MTERGHMALVLAEDGPLALVITLAGRGGYAYGLLDIEHSAHAAPVRELLARLETTRGQADVADGSWLAAAHRSADHAIRVTLPVAVEFGGENGLNRYKLRKLYTHVLGTTGREANPCSECAGGEFCGETLWLLQEDTANAQPTWAPWGDEDDGDELPEPPCDYCANWDSSAQTADAAEDTATANLEDGEETQEPNCVCEAAGCDDCTDDGDCSSTCDECGECACECRCRRESPRERYQENGPNCLACFDEPHRCNCGAFIDHICDDNCVNCGYVGEELARIPDRAATS